MDTSKSSSKELLFKQQLQNNKRGHMQVYLCKGDGNCLFRAISHQIWGNQERHMEMRRACCDYMLKHQIGREMYLSNDNEGYVSYINKKKLDGEWGDDPEIRAMEEMLDVKIEVWNSHIERGGIDPSAIHLTGSFPPNEKIKTIRISFHGCNHYNSIVLKGEKPHGIPFIENFGKDGYSNDQLIRKWRQNDQQNNTATKDKDNTDNGEEDDATEVRL